MVLNGVPIKYFPLALRSAVGLFMPVHPCIYSLYFIPAKRSRYHGTEVTLARVTIEHIKKHSAAARTVYDPWSDLYPTRRGSHSWVDFTYSTYEVVITNWTLSFDVSDFKRLGKCFLTKGPFVTEKIRKSIFARNHFVQRSANVFLSEKLPRVEMK